MRCFASSSLRLLFALSLLMGMAPAAFADVSCPSIFGSKMVLQRNQSNPVWGVADAGEKVTVQIADQTHEAVADDQGKWRIKLDPLPAGGPHELVISGNNELRFDDVLIGEVWICSGQSNMAWPINSSNDADLEKLTANFPQIRLISVPQVGTQEPQDDFNGEWQTCSGENIANFSAVGYFYGRQLHQTLGVPIGLIDNAWGGSACEAWVRRDLLEGDERFASLMEGWKEREANHDFDKQLANYEAALARWQEQAAKAREEGRNPSARPRRPRDAMVGQHRPANLYNGVLKPTIGYGIRGVIWYQGESNAARAKEYQALFPTMIESWRDEWDQGDFSFYWVQLADFQDEQDEPGESEWAELREAQTMTLDALPNTGQAVIIDLGEAHDIHPRDKQNVAKRLARLALANDYGFDIVANSPRFDSMERTDGKVLVKFRDVGGGLDTFDFRTPRGIAIAGEDRKFVWADARIVDKETLEVWSDQVKNPVAVRYSWASNPVSNLQNKEGLPVTPFRSDSWDETNN